MSSLPNVEELSVLIDKVINGLKTSKANEIYDLPNSIDFELAVVKEKEGKGQFKFITIGASGKISKEEISKVKFTLPKKQPVRTFM
jgi:hypothetical protein